MVTGVPIDEILSRAQEALERKDDPRARAGISGRRTQRDVTGHVATRGHAAGRPPCRRMDSARCPRIRGGGKKAHSAAKEEEGGAKKAGTAT